MAWYSSAREERLPDSVVVVTIRPDLELIVPSRRKTRARSLTFESAPIGFSRFTRADSMASHLALFSGVAGVALSSHRRYMPRPENVQSVKGIIPESSRISRAMATVAVCEWPYASTSTNRQFRRETSTPRRRLPLNAF